MSEIQLVLGLLVAVAALATLARRFAVPYPIFMVLGGLALGFIPGLPRLELAPELVFLFFLPPLIYYASFFTSIRDFNANLRAIALLAVGLVLFTTVVVAVVVQALVPGLGWAAAFTLGAIVSPPDAIAATAIFQRLGVPRKIVTILEGESLLNDATALVAYRFSLAALATGTFSLGDAALRFVLAAIGGIVVGVGVAWFIARLRARLADTSVNIMVSLLTPFAAYLPAEAIGASGVLAAVSAGLYLGRRASSFMSSETRVTGAAVWQTLVFALNGLVFILIGLQLPAILAGLEGRSAASLAGLAAAVSLAVIVARLVWVYPGAALVRLPIPTLRARETAPWRHTFLVAWPGMRGVVSLAAALALPRDFPERDLVLFLTFCIILTTLVGQGLSLPWLIRALGVVSDPDVAHDEAHARSQTAEVALARLDELAAEWPGHLELIDNLRRRYEHRTSHIEAHHDGPSGAAEQELLEHRQIFRGVLDAERRAALDLRDRGVISDQILRRIERDLDLEELRMEA